MKRKKQAEKAKEMKANKPKDLTKHLTKDELAALSPQEIVEYYTNWSYMPEKAVPVPSKLFLDTNAFLEDVAKIGQIAIQALGAYESVHKHLVDMGKADPVAEVSEAYEAMHTKDAPKMTPVAEEEEE